MKKQLISASLLSLLAACSSQTAPKSEVKNIGDRRMVSSFEGYDAFTNKHVGNVCVTYTKAPRVLVPNVGSVKFQANMNSSEMAKLFLGKAEGELTIDEISGKVNMELEDNHASSATASTVSFFVNIANGEITPYGVEGATQGGYTLTAYGQSVYDEMNKLSDEGISADDLWRKACGTDFVETTKFGAFIIGTMKVDWKSETAKKRFDGFISGDYEDTVKLQGDIKKFFESSTEDAAVSVSLSMNGGNALELSEIMPTDKLLDCRATAPKVGSDGKPLVGSQGLDKCLVAVKEMYNKLVKFRDLYDKKLGFTQGTNGTTDISDIDYSLFDFTEATHRNYQGIMQADGKTVATSLTKLKLTMDQAESVAEARKLLGSVYKDTQEIISRGDDVIAIDPTVDDSRRQEIRDLQMVAVSKLRRIGTARGRCYSDALAVNAVPCVQDLEYFQSNKVEVDFPINAKKHVLAPGGEGFMPWCTAFNMRLASTGRMKQFALTDESAKTLRAALDKIYANDKIPVTKLKDAPTKNPLDTVDAKGAIVPGPSLVNPTMATLGQIETTGSDVIDWLKLNCDKIDGKVRTTDKLDLSLQTDVSSAIGDVEPLLAFANLDDLNLSGQSLGAEKVAKLGQLQNLTHLDISSNGLTNPKPLTAGFYNLTHLNLGGNSFSNFLFTASPSADGQDMALQYLEELTLSDNVNLSRVELNSMPWLEKLSMKGDNKLRKDSLEKLSSATAERNVQLSIDLSDAAFIPTLKSLCSVNNAKAKITCGE